MGGCGNGVQEEQSLGATLCLNEVEVSEREWRKNIGFPYMAFGSFATATEDDFMDLEAGDVGIF